MKEKSDRDKFHSAREFLQFHGLEDFMRDLPARIPTTYKTQARMGTSV
jgi:hypothetical protein